MATYSLQPEQKNVVINPSMGLVFFQDQSVVYNYKTNQWTRLSSVSGKRFFPVSDNAGVLGTVEESGVFVMVQDSRFVTATAAQTATVITGDFELNPGGRAVIDGVRPISDGASLSSVRIGVRSLLSDSVTYATGSAINSRTGMSNFRGGANIPEGRYARAEFVFTGGFTTVTGADFEFYEAGEI